MAVLRPALTASLLVFILVAGGCAAPMPPTAGPLPLTATLTTAAAATAAAPPSPTAAAAPSPAPTAIAPTATPAPPTVTVTSVPEPAQAYSAVPDVLAAWSYDGWRTYTNKAYGFSLRYPAGWVAREVTNPADTMAGHRVTLRTPELPALKLHVAFKRAGEERRITPTGIGSGEVVERGVVPLLGTALPRQALVANGKDVGVLYGGSGEVKRGDLVFWISLEDAGSLPSDTGLTPDAEAIADAIIASIRRLPSP